MNWGRDNAGKTIRDGPSLIYRGEGLGGLNLEGCCFQAVLVDVHPAIKADK